MVFFVPNLGALSINVELDVAATDRASFASPELLSTAISKLSPSYVLFASPRPQARRGSSGTVACSTPSLARRCFLSLMGNLVNFRRAREIRLELIANNEFDSSS
jgi:hypothetical protein